MYVPLKYIWPSVAIVLQRLLWHYELTEQQMTAAVEGSRC